MSFNISEYLRCPRLTTILSSNWAGDEPVTHVALCGMDVYLLRGASNIASLFSNPGISATFSYSFALQKLFGMGKEAVEIYQNDNSGMRAKPVLGTFGSLD